MPIRIQNDLPAKKILQTENIFIMSHERAVSQDIRPLKIVILNLMPTKVETETQLLRLLGNSPLQVDIELLQMATHISKNTSPHHLTAFYKTFDEIRSNRYDGMIITGAPVEQLEYEDVDYWTELCKIMRWSRRNVCSTLHICWGAQAGLYYHYGIPKRTLPDKLSGVYKHSILETYHPLMRGFDDKFFMPHSRYTTVAREDVQQHRELRILAISNMAGPSIITDVDGRQVFVMGHCEYDRNTLAMEYFRDINKGISPKIPVNYFPDDNPAAIPPLTWRSHATLLFTNWLNYFVYQQTPYDLEKLDILNTSDE